MVLWAQHLEGDVKLATSQLGLQSKSTAPISGADMALKESCVKRLQQEQAQPNKFMMTCSSTRGAVTQL